MNQKEIESCGWKIIGEPDGRIDFYKIADLGGNDFRLKVTDETYSIYPKIGDLPTFKGKINSAKELRLAMWFI